jgi:flagellar hook protein FlgE
LKEKKMSLFGALSSGVSGLTAQSSAMGAISDNITNVSTIGYKNTKVSFQTLVTKQTSNTLYSAGGVQSKPRQATDVQGLLQASVSQTDIAIAGSGFFVVNEASIPTATDEYLYTRAGSFVQDNEGYLRNTSGYYLQGWPTDAAGVIIPANKNLTLPNQNVISNDYLTTINLNRVGGTATATSKVGIGANLPSSDTTGTTHKTDVQFFDTLGNANSISFVYTKSNRANEWAARVQPPPKTAVATLEDSSGNAIESIGQLEFTARPSDGATVVIDGKTYEFDSNASVTNAVAQVSTVTLATTGDLDIGDKYRATINATNVDYTIIAADTPTTSAQGLADAINANATVNGAVAATAEGAVVTIKSKTAGTAFTITASEPTDGDNDITATAATSTANAGTGNIHRVNVAGNTTTAEDVADLITAVRANDSDFADYGSFTNTRIRVNPDVTTGIQFIEDGSGTITINPAGLLDTSGNAVTTQTKSFNITETSSAYRNYQQFTFDVKPGNNETVTINSKIYTFKTSGEASGDGDLNINASGDLPETLADLEAAIEALDPQFAGTRVRVRAAGNDAAYNNTLVLESLSSGTFNAVFSASFGTAVTEPDGTSIATAAGDAATVAVNKNNAIIFNANGLPSTFNIGQLKINAFASGAAEMDSDPANAKKIALDFGNLLEANGMTQFGNEFTPVFITQNGSRFGSFAGVTISENGLTTALFDNGETRKIFQIPIATFVNSNSLEGRTGSVWNATENSGVSTLRTAGSGSAGIMTQSVLEASTVDIGEEFTNMIVVQRAYSATTKIIKTADEMLEELTRLL